MPKTLVASTTWANAVVVPEGGDPRRSTTVEPPFQQLTDRTGYLKNQVDVVGVNRLRYASSYVVARAITDFTEGDFIVIGYDGLYRFVAATTPNPFQYIINSSTVVPVTSGGSLCLVGVDKADYGGLHPSDAPVWTDSTGYLAYPEVVQNRIVSQAGACSGTGESDDSYDSCTTTLWKDLSDGSTPMLVNVGTLLSGDIVRVRATGGAEYLGTDTDAWIRARISYGGVASTIQGAAVRIQSVTPPYYIPWAISGRYVMPSNGASVEVKLQGRTGNNTLRIKEAISLDVDVIRP